MKHTAFLALLTTVLALPIAPAGAAVKVFLLAGQSNMLGVGPAAEMPAPYKAPQPDVKYWRTDGTGRGEGWVELRPRIVRDFFGPEVTFRAGTRSAVRTLCRPAAFVSLAAAAKLTLAAIVHLRLLSVRGVSPPTPFVRTRPFAVGVH